MRAAILAAILAACGCATMETRCAAIDWRALGLEDGGAGAPESAFERRSERCPGEDFASLYRQGRAEGLKAYCRPEIAFRVGERGEPYRGVCSGEADPAFVVEYERGLRLFEIKREAIAARQAESDLRAERWGLEERIMEAETALASALIKRADRAELHAKLELLRADLRAMDALAPALAGRRLTAEMALKSALLEAPVDAAPAVAPILASY